MKFLRRYADSLNGDQKIVSLIVAAAIMAPTAVLGPGAILRKKIPRTNVSTTELQDCVYTPCLPVDEKYRSYFEPTNLINSHGELNDAIAVDAMASRHRRLVETGAVEMEGV